MHAQIERFERPVRFMEMRNIFELITRKPVNVVRLSVTFTEEEKAIIKKRKLTDDTAFRFNFEYLSSGVTLSGGPTYRELMKGPYQRVFHISVLEATNFERELRETHLPSMKSTLNMYGGVTSSSSSAVNL